MLTICASSGMVIASQSVRIAAAVDPLVVMADDRAARLRRIGPSRQRSSPMTAMAFHQVVFLPRQLSFLEQHPIGNRDLADIVEKRARGAERIELV